MEQSGRGWRGRKGGKIRMIPTPLHIPTPLFLSGGHGAARAPAVLHHHPPVPARGRSQGMQLPSKSPCCGYFWPFLGCYFSKNPTSRGGTRGVAPAGGSPELLQASLSPSRTSQEPEVSLGPAVTAAGDTGVAAQQPPARAGGDSRGHRALPRNAGGARLVTEGTQHLGEPQRCPPPGSGVGGEKPKLPGGIFQI